MKTITVVIPTYNEEENIPIVYERVMGLSSNIPNYQIEILFIDNNSTDHSQEKIQMLSQNDTRVKAIFNAKNFGFNRSTFYGLTQATGDAAVLLFADMQDPPETIIDFVREWEDGYKIVVGIKNKSKESRLMYFIRSCYYKFIEMISDIDHIRQFTGFGLYDKSFINILGGLDDSLPYLRGIVAELGYRRTEVYYKQDIRKYGKTNFNFLKLYDVAMLGITSYSKVLLRCSTLLGFGLSILCVIIAMVTLLIKLLNWNYFLMGTAALVVGVFFIGAIQLFFIGLLGEYVLNMSTRIMNRPLVIEERRINFDDKDDKKETSL